MLTMVVLRPCLPIACRISLRFLSRNFHLINSSLRIDRTRKCLHLQPHLFIEQQTNCFNLTKVLFNTNSPDAPSLNDANESAESKNRLSSKRRRIVSDSDSSDGENGTQDVNRKSECVACSPETRIIDF